MTSVEQNDRLIIYAMRNYDNPHCFDLIEFQEDYNRILVIKKLLKKYIKNGVLKERLILNHFTVLYNCFGDSANSIIFSVLDKEFYKYLKPFIVFLNRDTEFVYTIFNSYIILDDIESDNNISQALQIL